MSCEVLLQPIEWRALYCRVHSTTKLPNEPPSLAQVMRWIAKLGGYLARKHDRPPPGQLLYGVAFSSCTKSPRCIASSGKTSDPYLWVNLRSFMEGIKLD
nr:IS4 family transposase [Mycetohabitans sp. B6]